MRDTYICHVGLWSNNQKGYLFFYNWRNKDYSYFILDLRESSLLSASIHRGTGNRNPSRSIHGASCYSLWSFSLMYNAAFEF